eukprot:Phypoly_transcript_05264.p1 GENE.Phypoly_transcript_05264~~Phypoly_transcript_05264.p1  ORF type:complete len:652 (+),score=106.77 Phypoly_transcript_05264:70-1956(+)
MSCAEEGKVIMVGGSRKYPAVNYHIIDLASGGDVKSCTSVAFKGAPVDWCGLTSTRVGAKIFIFGGYRENDNYCYNDLFSIDTRTRQISRHESYDIEGRTEHTACVVGRKIYFFAGRKAAPSTSSLVPCADLLVLDTGTLQWNKINTDSNRPCDRYAHAAAAVGSLIFVHGGIGNDDVHLDDLWIFDTGKSTWTEAKLKVTGVRPPAMARHTMAAHGCRIFLFGSSPSSNFPVFFVLDAVNMEWHNLDYFDNLPSERYGHTSDISGGQLLVLGGTSPTNTFLGDLHAFEIGDTQHLLPIPSPLALTLRTSMLTLLNNPLFSDLTLYISTSVPKNSDSKNGDSKNSTAQATRDADARAICLHKCIVFSRFPDFPRFFMRGNADASEVDLCGYCYDVVYSAMQILYSDWSQVKPQHTDEFAQFTAEYHLERITQICVPDLAAPDAYDAQPAQDPTQSLAQDLSALLHSQLRSDVVFRAQDTRFRAHRAVLTARSTYFHALFTGSMRESLADAEVDLDAVDPHAFDVVLRHLYAAPVDLAQVGLDLLEVLELCVRYLIEDLRVQVTRFLIEHLDMENAIALYEAAMVLDCAELKLACMEFIGWHFEDICRLKEFHAMSEQNRATVQSYYKL